MPSLLIFSEYFSDFLLTLPQTTLAVLLQVSCDASSGQYSLQAVGVHCHVLTALQVLALPPSLQAPAPAAAARAAKLAEAAAVPLPPVERRLGGSSSSSRRALQQQQEVGVPVTGGEGRSAAAAISQEAAAAAGAEAARQMRQLVEAGLRGICLDEAGMVEFAWTRQRTAPARWLRTVAGVPLGARAAGGSLQVLPGGSSSNSSKQGAKGSVRGFVELLPGEMAEEDGLPVHWVVEPRPGRGAAVVAASKTGRVLHLQRLTAAEGRLLLALQDVLLMHPLTGPMVLGRQQLLEQQLQGRDGVVLGPSGVEGQVQAEAVGLHARRLGVVDAQVLGLFLLLPYDMQLLLLDSVLPQHGRGWCGGVQGVVSGEAQLLQDGLRCRLQLLHLLQP